jgi:hypothetical protein
MLPHPVPDGLTARLIWFRRGAWPPSGCMMPSALMMMQGFGLHFRKPLCLLRAFMLELSQTAERPIALAPVAACA